MEDAGVCFEGFLELCAFVSFAETWNIERNYFFLIIKSGGKSDAGRRKEGEGAVDKRVQKGFCSRRLY